MKRKITVTTGTRAEYGMLRPVLHALFASKKLDPYLIVAGMHLSKKYGMTINEIKKDGFKIFARVDMVPKGDSTFFMSKSLGEGILRFSEIFRKLKPDINLILGDRDEALASALTASHMNIPNAHIHGGDRTQAGVDEYNRHAITKISNIHFTATKKSRERIIKMGENPKYVFLTGSPSIDEAITNITDKKILEKKYNIKFTNSEILLLQHPVTTQTEKTEEQIRNILNAVIKVKNTTIAILPNSDAGHMTIFRYLKYYSKKYDFIRTHANVPRSDYLGMLKNCGILLGNSSSGIIEASYFNIPVINIGIRQKDRERDKNVIDVTDESSDSIYHAITSVLKRKKSSFRSQHVYGTGNATKKIVHYLEKINLDKELIQKQIFY
ncbi:MAG: UDP-N-acetylglucosamine 2-epimerase [Nitrosopumilaceae archaeon]